MCTHIFSHDCLLTISAMCGSGTFSSTRLPPCQVCPLNTIWVNSTYCRSCGANEITRVYAATAASQCKGEFIYRGGMV